MQTECASSAGPVNAGQGLVLKVRAAFVARGKTLTGWCREQGVDHALAFRALSGDARARGPKAKALAQRILAEVGL